jgi:hypothetical protein
MVFQVHRAPRAACAGSIEAVAWAEKEAGRKNFFFEKKKQKTFALAPA